MYSENGANPRGLQDLEWFSRSSYQLALEVCKSWTPSLVLRLLDVSVQASASAFSCICVNDLQSHSS
jgi:hypothetical protein